MTEGKDYKEKYKKVFGEHTMNHGSTRFPNEIFMMDTVTEVTHRQKAVLLALMATNSFEREQKHLPTYISQEKLGYRIGIAQPAVSNIYKQLKEKEFKCPFCWDEKKQEGFKLKGYIRVEKTKRRTRKNPWGADHVWTDGYKEIINHLCMHYQEYHDKYGSEEAPDRFILDILELRKKPKLEPEEVPHFGSNGDF